MRDADEDGYGDANLTFSDCLTVGLFDSWGDSTFGGDLIITADEVDLDVDESLENCTDATLCDLTGGGYDGSFPTTYSSQEICFEEADEVIITYTTPVYYLEEVGYRITSQDGTVLAEEGFVVDEEVTDKDWLIASNIEQGSDCNDDEFFIHANIDFDADGFGACDDCDDTNVDINPDAEEILFDGIDQDCDGLEDDTDIASIEDYDMDGYTVVGGDCDDSDPYTYVVPLN